jgi:hypothetical protein
MQVLMTVSKQCQDGTEPFPSSVRMELNRFQAVRMELSTILTLLGSGHQNLYETYQCRKYSGKLLMMGKEDARNM